MRNTYHLKILTSSAYWPDRVVARSYNQSGGAYIFYDKNDEDKHVVVASYPVERTIIESISYGNEE